jgi:hypothetical protein
MFRTVAKLALMSQQKRVVHVPSPAQFDETLQRHLGDKNLFVLVAGAKNEKGGR